jgi:hypothetical protein
MHPAAYRIKAVFILPTTPLLLIGEYFFLAFKINFKRSYTKYGIQKRQGS